MGATLKNQCEVYSHSDEHALGVDITQFTTAGGDIRAAGLPI